MSGNNKNDKDSYAKDTLAFNIPPQGQRNRPPRQPQQRPQQNEYNEYQNEYYNDEYYPQQDSYGYPSNGQGQNPQYQQRQYSQGYQQGQPYNNGNGYNRPQNTNRSRQGGNSSRPHPQGHMPGRPHNGQPQRRNNSQQAGGQNPQQRYQEQRRQGTPPNPQQRQNGNRPQQNPQRRPQQGRPVQKSNVRKAPPSQYRNNQPKQKVKKKRVHHGGCLTKIIFSLLGLLIVLFIIYSVISLGLISKIEKVETGERIGPSNVLYDSSSVKNILLIGTDSRGEDRGRSDSMILLSINSKTNKMNMVSLMRDTYVDVPGYGGCKLNAAYSYGGPELLMDTIEENFRIKIDDYMTVNFMSFASIVDAVGGVTIEVTDNEADAINVLLDSNEGVSMFGQPDESDYLNGGGTYKLNGKQALCYSRLRKVGNADFERTERQRKVLSEILKNASTANPFKLSSLAGKALPSLATNMSTLDMYVLSLRLPLFMIGYDINQLRIPAEDTYWSADIDGQDVLEIDTDANLSIIENDLYGK